MILPSEQPLESPLTGNSKSNHKLYLNKREKLEQKHECELFRCKGFFDVFFEKYKNNLTNGFNFNKVLEVVKVPFTTLPSICQIKGFFQNYISRERRRKYLKKGLWNEKELKLLLWALVFYSESICRKIDEFLDSDWSEISQLFPNTLPMKCKAKWYSIKKSKFMRTKWTISEDNLLIEMMQKLPEKGKISWNDLATTINNSLYNGEFIRTGRHCRDRWVHHLNPKLSRLQWTQEEDLRIIKYVLTYGKKWANLAKTMENRNEDSIRNRFIKLIKSCRNKEKQEKGKSLSKENYKPEGKILSRLLADLSKNPDFKESIEIKTETNKHLYIHKRTRGSSLKREGESIEKIIKKQQLEQPELKIEQESDTLNIKTEKITQISQNDSTKSSTATNTNTGSINPLGMMSEMWDQLTFHNQMLYQEMFLQRMRVMMGNFLWMNAQNQSQTGLLNMNTKLNK